jgi:BCD family chlorophyll transporter-like MFS transporter
MSRLAGSLLGGIVRDGVTQATGVPLSGYMVVFVIEATMLATAALMLARIDVSAFKRRAAEPTFAEKVALAVE